MSDLCVAITGGIGSGKSVVNRVLRLMGYPVYDSDEHAKLLMSYDPEVRSALSTAFGETMLTSHGIDNNALASLVFADKLALSQLNAIVHPAVLKDFLSWRSCQHGLCFIETALLHESGLDKVVERAWYVEAPLETRVSRVMKRNGVAREQVLERIKVQTVGYTDYHCPVDVLTNDDATALIPQIIKLIEKSEL